MIEPLDFLVGWKDKIYITVEEKAKEIGKVILTDDVRMRSQVGIVQVVGEDVVGLEKGDRILISFGAGIHIQLPETYSFEPHHRIITEHEILMRMKK